MLGGIYSNWPELKLKAASIDPSRHIGILGGGEKLR